MIGDPKPKHRGTTTYEDPFLLSLEKKVEVGL